MRTRSTSTIYTNGAYHIERINESDWLSLACGETTDGKATITAECEFNEDFKRKAGIVLCSDVDSRRDTLYIKQKALIDARIAFANSSIIVPGGRRREQVGHRDQRSLLRHYGGDRILRSREYGLDPGD